MTGPKVVPIRTGRSATYPNGSAFHQRMADARRAVINEALDAAGGNRAHAAAALGIQRTYLLRMMREFKASGTVPPSEPRAVRGLLTR